MRSNRQALECAHRVSTASTLCASSDCTALMGRELVHALRGHTSTVRCLKVLNGRPVAISGSRDHTLRVWDTAKGECLRVLVGHEQSVRCMEVAGNRLVSGSYDYTCRVSVQHSPSLLQRVLTDPAVGRGHGRMFACSSRSLPPDLRRRIRWRACRLWLIGLDDSCMERTYWVSIGLLPAGFPHPSLILVASAHRCCKVTLRSSGNCSCRETRSSRADPTVASSPSTSRPTPASTACAHMTIR